MDNNKITVNGKEYDLRDLSEKAVNLVQVLTITENKVATLNAELVALGAGRQTLTNQLIEEVEKETTTNG